MRVAEPTGTEVSRTSWPEDGLEQLGHCPVCGSSARELVHCGLRDRVSFSAPGQWNLFRCAVCGSGYLDPRPNAETIGLAYANYYTHTNATAVERPPRSRWRKFR